MDAKNIRKRAGRSMDWTAVMAGVSTPTVRIYELSRDAVTDAKKRAALDRVYAHLQDRADESAAA